MGTFYSAFRSFNLFLIMYSGDLDVCTSNQSFSHKEYLRKQIHLKNYLNFLIELVPEIPTYVLFIVVAQINSLVYHYLYPNINNDHLVHIKVKLHQDSHHDHHNLRLLRINI